jgi:two-component system, sensor histidine kinase and response regulator
MDQLVQLSRETGGKLLPNMVAAFLNEECPAALKRIRAGIIASNRATIAEAAHKVRGSAATFGATQLTTACSELERRAKAGRLADAEGLLRQIEGEIASVGRALAKYGSAEGPIS